MSDTKQQNSSAFDYEHTTTEQIYEEVIIQAEIYSKAIRQFMSSFMFYEKTLEEWAGLTSIEIPKEITPEILQQLYLELTRRLQQASYFYTTTNSTYNAINSNSKLKQADIITALTDWYRQKKAKRPAAKILEDISCAYLGDTQQTKIIAQIVRDFWKEKRDNLIEVRKCLEQISISMHVEQKYLNK
jgi:hypothetical protein